MSSYNKRALAANVKNLFASGLYGIFDSTLDCHVVLESLQGDICVSFFYEEILLRRWFVKERMYINCYFEKKERHPLSTKGIEKLQNYAREMPRGKLY